MVLVGLIVSLAAGVHCQTWRHGLSDVFYCFIWFLPNLFWGCVICGVLFCSRREEGFLFFSMLWEVTTWLLSTVGLHRT